jgi:hypothetical protein
MKLRGNDSIIGGVMCMRKPMTKTQPTGDAGGRLACGVVTSRSRRKSG